MANMRPPTTPEEPPEMGGEEDVMRLMAACKGTGFEERRDAAIVNLFYDTEMRRAELAGLRLEDLDLDAGVVVVLGRGRRPRACPFGTVTARALPGSRGRQARR